MRRIDIALIVLLACGPGLAGCGAGADAAGEAAPPATEEAPVHVDSILPIDEEIRRFRARVGRSVEALDGSEPSRDALIARFVAALEAADTATLARLTLDPAEFIDLYYPHTMYTSKPYELSPSVVWILVSGNSEKGLVRLLRRFAGAPLGYRGHTCEETPKSEGPNRLHEGCIIDFAASGRSEPLRMFGSILERDGRFAFVSYANDL